MPNQTLRVRKRQRIYLPGAFLESISPAIQSSKMASAAGGVLDAFDAVMGDRLFDGPAALGASVI